MCAFYSGGLRPEANIVNLYFVVVIPPTASFAHVWSIQASRLVGFDYSVDWFIYSSTAFSYNRLNGKEIDRQTTRHSGFKTAFHRVSLMLVGFIMKQRIDISRFSLLLPEEFHQCLFVISFILFKYAVSYTY